MAPYTPTVWVNDQAPALSAANLNKLTDELEAQASELSIGHVLPTWANGASPALSDAAPLNEIERVVKALSAAVGLTYTETAWSSGWTPARNAARFNRLEQQVQAIRVLLDATTLSPLAYLHLGGASPPSNGNSYRYTLVEPPNPVAVGLDGLALGYRSLTNVSKTMNYGVNYAQAAPAGWVLKDTSGAEVVNPGYTTNVLGDVGHVDYQAAWCANTLAWLNANSLNGFYADDSHIIGDGQGHASAWNGAAYPAKYPTLQSWHDALLSGCAAVGSYFRSRGFYVAHNTSQWIADDPYSNTGERRLVWWADLAPHADGLMIEGYMRMLGSPVRRVPTTQYWDYFEEHRLLHKLCAGQTVLAIGQPYTVARPLDIIAVEDGSDSEAFEQRYTLAAFLLDWNGQNGVHIWWQQPGGDPWSVYHAAALALGAPTGAASKSGDEWVRTFENGVVRLNPVAGTASMDTGGAILFQDDFETNYSATMGLNPNALAPSAPWPPGKPACALPNSWGTWGRNTSEAYGSYAENVVPPVPGKGSRCMRFNLVAAPQKMAIFAESGTNRVIGERYYGTMFYLPPTWREPAGLPDDTNDLNGTRGCMLNEIVYWPYIAGGGEVSTHMHADSLKLAICSGDGVYGVNHSSGSNYFPRYSNGGGYLLSLGAGQAYAEGNMGSNSNWMVIPPGEMDKEVWHETIIGVNWQIDNTGFWKAWWRRKGEANWNLTVNVGGYPTHWWGTDNAGCTYTAQQMIGSPTYTNLGPYRERSNFPLYYYVDNYVEATSFNAVAATMP